MFVTFVMATPTTVSFMVTHSNVSKGLMNGAHLDSLAN